MGDVSVWQLTKAKHITVCRWSLHRENCVWLEQVEAKTYTHIFPVLEWDFMFITQPAASHKRSSGKEGTSSSCPSRPHRRRSGQVRVQRLERLPGSSARKRRPLGPMRETPRPLLRIPVSGLNLWEPPHNPSLGPKAHPSCPQRGMRHTQPRCWGPWGQCPQQESPGGPSSHHLAPAPPSSPLRPPTAQGTPSRQYISTGLNEVPAHTLG